jgi:aconitate hydratase
VVDLAAMRDAIAKALGGNDASRSTPQVPVHLVIDHSVMVDEFGTPQAFEHNVALEYQRNMRALRVSEMGFQGARQFLCVVPPGTGICHQVNLENIARGVWTSKPIASRRDLVAYPDTCVGTDSHTTMINGLGVLGWGVGGIEAEAAMLGQPVSMLIPEVVGFKLTGALAEGITATDLVLTVTCRCCAACRRGRAALSNFTAPGLEESERSPIARPLPIWHPNMARPAAISRSMTRRWPICELTGRERPGDIALTEAYAQGAGFLALSPRRTDAIYTDTLELDISTVVPSLAGPKRPQHRVGDKASSTRASTATWARVFKRPDDGGKRVDVDGSRPGLCRWRCRDCGDHFSCTNTSNPTRAGRRRPRRAQGARNGAAASSPG